MRYPFAALGMLGWSLLFALVGCSGTAASFDPPPGSATIQSHAPESRLQAAGVVTDVGLKSCPAARVYVADYTGNAVVVYPAGVADPAPCGKITAGVSRPNGVDVDAKGTVYVANIDTNTVTEYPRNRSTPTVTLSSGVQSPIDTHVGADGTVYIAEYLFNLVLEFAPGATSPTRTIAITNPEGVATDKRNNLYVSYNDNFGAGRVERYAPRATTGTDLGIVVGYARDVEYTKSDELVFADSNDFVVNVYPRGKTSPSQSMHTGRANPYHIALNRAETRLYNADPSQGPVTIYDFATGAPVNKITKGLVSASAVALDPVQIADE